MGGVFNYSVNLQGRLGNRRIRNAHAFPGYLEMHSVHRCDHVCAASMAALRGVIKNGIAGTEMPGAWQLHPREVESVAAYVRSLGTVAIEALPGNTDRGAELYRATGCASCHVVEGQGSGFGPELSEIGAR